MPDQTSRNPVNRRRFLKQCTMGSCAAALGTYTFWDLLVQGGDSGLRVGFHNDAPETLWQWSKEALWYERHGALRSPEIYCKLCPHQCVLGENDRGLCRTRVVKNGRLHTVAYGNPCAVHIDP
ncbi:MAG TPA: twin-arginine translocation signal domain-containing protein, partial [Oligoflexia bacterium]|nr:twin-arginine translocation signal domain-containing protein [Oligoflexia bacterium]